MAWTAPATFTDGAILTAAQLNAMRDNFNETAPAKATAAGGFIVTAGLNSVVQRTPTAAQINIAGTTTSTSFTDPSGDVGPAVTATTGATALVAISSRIEKNVADTAGLIGFAVSGATTIAASDDWAATADGAPANQPMRIGVTMLRTALATGSNTFTMKYKVSSGTGTFAFRHIAVVPF